MLVSEMPARAIKRSSRPTVDLDMGVDSGEMTGDGVLVGVGARVGDGVAVAVSVEIGVGVVVGSSVAVEVGVSAGDVGGGAKLTTCGLWLAAAPLRALISTNPDSVSSITVSTWPCEVWTTGTLTVCPF